MIRKTRQNMEAKPDCMEGRLEVLPFNFAAVAHSCHKSRTIFNNKTPVFRQIGYNFLVEVTGFPFLITVFSMRGLRSVTLELLASLEEFVFPPLVLQLSTIMGKNTRFDNRIFVESLQLFPPTVINIINGENLGIYFPLNISFILPKIESASVSLAF